MTGVYFPEENPPLHAQEKFQPAIEDIRNTKHNLSINPPDLSLYPPINPPEGLERNVSTQDTSEICIFCHTPHGANSDAVSAVKAPIWNRFLSSANYTLYDQVWSRSFEGFEGDVNPGVPTGYSRLCLSCHDGTIALGSVVNKAGSGGLNSDPNNPSYTMTYRPGQSPESEGGIAGSIPIGSGSLTGDTRRLGTDLTNDHPVSFVYNTALADIDEELVYPGDAPNNTRPGSEPVLEAVKRFPGEDLNKANAVQCTSCHNPHTVTYPKFLRASLLQGSPNPSDQIICLFCHDKPGWPGNPAELNTHALSPAIHNKYPTVENPYDYDGEHSVEQYACRNCHDPHTVQGAKRLHREGVDPLSTLDSTEATCYLCHSPNTGGVNLIAGTTPDPLFLSGNPAPDVYTQFKKDPNFPLDQGGTGSAMNVGIGQGHKPVFTAKSREGVELQPDMAGTYGPLNNRVPPIKVPDTPDTMHIECVDCHNPHQVTGPSFSAVPNRMKGMKGIDIGGNVVGHGVQGNDREVYIYEVCFRCHGNSYSQLFINDHYPGTTQYRSTPSDLNPPPWGWLPEFGPPPPPSDQNEDLSFPGFSNKRLEFNPDSNPDSQGMIGKVQYNPSFHPVAIKGRNQSFALSPNNPDRALLGGLSSERTIMCTDCHNTDDIGDIKGPVTTSRPGFSDANRNDILQDSDVIDNQTGAIGPHGSRNIRILRGNYNTRSSSDCRGSITPDCKYRPDITIFNNFTPMPVDTKYQQFELCFRCHDRRVFIDGTSENTNFYGRYNKKRNSDEKFSYLDIAAPITVPLWTGNLHYMHIRYSDAKCHDCHNNVHSNLQAPNTIYGNHNGDCVGYPGDNPPQPDNECYQDLSDPNFGLPPNNNPQDDGTDGNGDTQHTDLHLINFNPVSVRGNQSSKPRWYWGKSKWEDDSITNPSQKYMNCDLRCHGRVMNECSYQYEILSTVSPTTTRFSNCDIMDPILFP